MSEHVLPPGSYTSSGKDTQSGNHPMARRREAAI